MAGMDALDKNLKLMFKNNKKWRSQEAWFDNHSFCFIIFIENCE
jgi:membrane protein DedA with SNARE-associated domain